MVEGVELDVVVHEGGFIRFLGEIVAGAAAQGIPSNFGVHGLGAADSYDVGAASGKDGGEAWVFGAGVGFAASA